MPFGEFELPVTWSPVARCLLYCQISMLLFIHNWILAHLGIVFTFTKCFSVHWLTWHTIGLRHWICFDWVLHVLWILHLDSASSALGQSDKVICCKNSFMIVMITEDWNEKEMDGTRIHVVLSSLSYYWFGNSWNEIPALISQLKNFCGTSTVC